MNRTNEIVLANPGFHTMEHNGYIKEYILGIILDKTLRIKITYNKEYFN